jgi:hypothetical protein
VVQRIADGAGGFDDGDRRACQKNIKDDRGGFGEALRNRSEDAPRPDRISRDVFEGAGNDHGAPAGRVVGALKAAGRENPGEDGGENDDGADQQQRIHRSMFCHCHPKRGWTNIAITRTR